MTFAPSADEVVTRGSIRLSVNQIFASVVLVVSAAGLLMFAANSGGTLEHPVGHRVYEVGMAAIAIVVFAVGAWQSMRTGRLSPMLLASFAAGTAFWQETYGDWGTYLRYSLQFIHYGATRMKEA